VVRRRKRSLDEKPIASLAEDDSRILNQVSAKDFDAIIVPGGYASEKVPVHHLLIDPLRKARNLGQLLPAFVVEHDSLYRLTWSGHVV
jgi:putative intracellular protease/amidase